MGELDHVRKGEPQHGSFGGDQIYILKIHNFCLNVLFYKITEKILFVEATSDLAWDERGQEIIDEFKSVRVLYQVRDIINYSYTVNIF